MYIKYIMNYWSVWLYRGIHTEMKVIYFEQGLVARGGFCRRGVLSVPPSPNVTHCLSDFRGH